MIRLVALTRRSRRPFGPVSGDRAYGMGTCRWCLSVIALRSAAWVHFATGHPSCVDPPLGAPITAAAQPLPPAPLRWRMLFPADTRHGRIAWLLGMIAGTTDADVPERPRPSPAVDWPHTNLQPQHPWPAYLPPAESINRGRHGT